MTPSSNVSTTSGLLTHFVLPLLSFKIHVPGALVRSLGTFNNVSFCPVLPSLGVLF